MAKSKEQEIPEGYKQTEIGVIPEDWDVQRLVDVAPLQRGFDLPTSQLRIGPFPVVYSNGILNFHNKAMAKGPGVITGRSGTIGKVHYVDQDYWPHNTTLWVTDFKGNDEKYVYFLYSHLKIERFSIGSGVPTLNRNDVHHFLVGIPKSKIEQTAISTALSDVDSLLRKTEELIEKKKKIKQGAMQELLTGKHRLPGFQKKPAYKRTEIGIIPNDWDLKRLVDVFSVSAGRDLIKDLYSPIRDDIHPFPIYSNSLEQKGLYGYTKIPRHKENCLTITARGTIGRANARDHKFDAIGRLLVLEPKVKCNCFFMSDYINNRLHFSIESTGVPQLTAPQASQYTVPYPSSEEQTAIAKVLSDMDSEIEKLESKLIKYKNIKQGMMQNLLTGKIRLIKK